MELLAGTIGGKLKACCRMAGICLVGLALSASFVFAQEGPAEAAVQTGGVIAEPPLGALVTDRPDFTESAEVVGPWVAQFETGVMESGESSGGVSVRTFGVPFALLRLGLTRNLELRFGTDGLLRETTKIAGQSTRISGMADFGIGAKLKLFDESSNLPALAIIPAVSLPSGSDEFTSSGYDPSINLAWAKSLPKGFGLGGNVKFQSLTEDDERFFQHAVSFSLGHGLFNNTGTYWEVYKIGPISRDGDDLYMFNTGLTQGIGGNAQLDFSVGRSLSPTTPNWFVGVGFTFRSRIR